MPSVYANDDVANLKRVRATGSGTETELYVARLTPDGSMAEARFPATVLPDGQPLRIRIRDGVAELRTSADRVVASAALERTRLDAFPRIDRPARLHAKRSGRIVRLRWRAQRGVAYVVTAGRTQDTRVQRPIARVKARGRRTIRTRVRVRRNVRWIGVTGFRDTGRGPTAYVRLGRSRRQGA